MPNLRELEKITREEARAILKRRKARKVKGSRPGRLPTDKVKVSEADVTAFLHYPNLRVSEVVWLYRTRAGKLQREVAEELGVSRLWVNRMEQGLADPSRLIEYWEV